MVGYFACNIKNVQPIQLRLSFQKDVVCLGFCSQSVASKFFVVSFLFALDAVSKK